MTEIDPFDLPDWLGEGEVTWTAERGLEGHRVTGCLAGPAGQSLACDLLAVDQAYPAPVLDETGRTRVHQAWRHGQVLLLTLEGRLTVAVPGTRWTADRVLTAVSGLARALGADAAGWAVRLGLAGRDDRPGER